MGWCLLGHDWQHTPDKDYPWMSSYSTFTCSACGTVKVDPHPTAETGKWAEKQQHEDAREIAVLYSFQDALDTVDISEQEYDRAMAATLRYQERYFQL